MRDPQQVYDEVLRLGREQGRAEARRERILQDQRETLLEIYTLRFGPPPESVRSVVASCNDGRLLRAWLHCFLLPDPAMIADILSEPPPAPE